MKKRIHRSNERGAMNIGWLQAKYSFSFARYYNPERMAFGTLRVLNNDIIAPGAGFDTHHHENFEIVTIPLSGAVHHKDSQGNEGIVPAGEVQVMSAGSGISHSEYNVSTTEPLELFQIWFETDTQDVKPRYEQAAIKHEDDQPLTTIVSRVDDEKGAVGIYQNVRMSVLELGEEESFTYEMLENRNGLFAMVIEGSATVQEEVLEKRDSIELIDETKVTIQASTPAKLLLIEVQITNNDF